MSSVLSANTDALLAKSKFYLVVGGQRGTPNALDHLNEAIAKDGSFFPALLEKAKIMISIGEWSQANDAAQRVLQLNEENMRALKIICLEMATHEADPRGLTDTTAEEVNAASASLASSSSSGRGKRSRAATPVSWSSCSPETWALEKMSTRPPLARTLSKSSCGFGTTFSYNAMRPRSSATSTSSRSRPRPRRRRGRATREREVK